MNGEYKISNPNPLSGAKFDSDYSKFSDVEYFDVSLTKPRLFSASTYSTIAIGIHEGWKDGW